jgi:limonene-1,2-epoxide hydrolase
MSEAAATAPPSAGTEPKIEILRRLQAAIARRDIEAFLDFFSPEIEYHYHVGTRPLIGLEWVRKFMLKYWRNNSQATWIIERHAETGDALLTEGREEYVNADGQTVTHPYMGVIEFADGKITRWRDYFQMQDPNAGK